MTQPKLLGVAPVLLVKNIQKSADYWHQKLGFSQPRLWGDPASFCMPERDGMLVMLSEAPDGHEIIPHWKVCPQVWNAYFWVDNIDSLYEEFKKNGALIDYHIDNKDYGVREFGIQDLEGHDIAFGQELIE